MAPWTVTPHRHLQSRCCTLCPFPNKTESNGHNQISLSVEKRNLRGPLWFGNTVFQIPSLLLTLPKAKNGGFYYYDIIVKAIHKGEWKIESYKGSLSFIPPCFIYKIKKKGDQKQTGKKRAEGWISRWLCLSFLIMAPHFYSRVVAVSFLESLLLSPLPFSLHSFDRSLRSHRPRIRHRHPLGEKCGTTFLPLWLKPAERRWRLRLCSWPSAIVGNC